MIKTLLRASLLLLCLAATETAFAGPIILFDESRAVRAHRQDVYSYDQPGAFLATVIDPGSGTTSSQDSLIDPGFLGGSGMITRPADAVGIEVFSMYETRFTIDEDYWASLNIALVSDHWSAVAYTVLYDLGEGEEFFGANAQASANVAAFEGLLTPGSYGLQIFAVTTNGPGSPPDLSASASWNGGLTLTPIDAAPVPEPATMTMLGLGLAVAGAKRWRARRPQSRDGDRR